MASPDTDELTQLIQTTLEAHKAVDIQMITVSALTDITDRIIICTATSTRHASSMAEKLLRAAREAGIRPLGIEGEQTESDWMLVDFQDIIVHIMLRGARDFYDLESLWTKAARNRPQEED